MTSRDQLLEEIEAFLDQTGMKPTNFGRLAVQDSAFVTRLRGGADVRLSTAERVKTFIASQAGPKRRCRATTCAK